MFEGRELGDGGRRSLKFDSCFDLRENHRDKFRTLCCGEKKSLHVCHFASLFNDAKKPSALPFFFASFYVPALLRSFLLLSPQLVRQMFLLIPGMWGRGSVSTTCSLRWPLSTTCLYLFFGLSVDDRICGRSCTLNQLSASQAWNTEILFGVALSRCPKFRGRSHFDIWSYIDAMLEGFFTRLASPLCWYEHMERIRRGRNPNQDAYVTMQSYAFKYFL